MSLRCTASFRSTILKASGIVWIKKSWTISLSSDAKGSTDWRRQSEPPESLHPTANRTRHQGRNLGRTDGNWGEAGRHRTHGSKRKPPCGDWNRLDNPAKT